MFFDIMEPKVLNKNLCKKKLINNMVSDSVIDGQFSHWVAVSTCLFVWDVSKHPFLEVLENSGQKMYSLYIPVMTQFSKKAQRFFPQIS